MCVAFPCCLSQAEIAAGINEDIKQVEIIDAILAIRRSYRYWYKHQDPFSDLMTPQTLDSPVLEHPCTSNATHV